MVYQDENFLLNCQKEAGNIKDIRSLEGLFENINTIVQNAMNVGGKK